MADECKLKIIDRGYVACGRLKITCFAAVLPRWCHLERAFKVGQQDDGGQIKKTAAGFPVAVLKIITITAD